MIPVNEGTGQLLLRAHAQRSLAIIYPYDLPQYLLESLVAAVDEEVTRDAILGRNASLVPTIDSNQPPVSPVLLLLEKLAAGEQCDRRLPGVILNTVEQLLGELFPDPGNIAERDDKDGGTGYPAWTTCRLLKALAPCPALGEAEARRFSAVLRAYGVQLVNAAFKGKSQRACELACILRLFLSNPAVPLCVVEEWLEPISLLRWVAPVSHNKQVLADYPPDLICTTLKATYMSNADVMVVVEGVLNGLLGRKLPEGMLVRVLLTAIVFFRGQDASRRIIQAIADSPSLTPEMLSILVTAASYFDDSSSLNHIPSQLLANPALPQPVVEAIITEAMSAPENHGFRTRWAIDVLDMLAQNPSVSNEDLAAACLSSNSEVAEHARKLLAARLKHGVGADLVVEGKLLVARQKPRDSAES